MFKVNNKDTRTTPVPPHIETSQLICSANQLTGFYMIYMIGYWRRSGVFIVKFEHISPANQLPGFLHDGKLASFWSLYC